MMTVKEALAQAGAYLRKGGIGAAALEAELLLAHCTGMDRAALIRDHDLPLTPAQVDAFFTLVRRRGEREPVAYLTGEREFMGLSLWVNRHVLIPRPETELLVERVLDLESKNIIVDVGAGSGAIAVSLAVLLPGAVVYATDISAEALEVAQKNAARHGVGHRISFSQGDLLSPLAGRGLEGKVDVVAANLPYVPAGELPGLMPDVREYEPLQALDGGPDGLDLYRRLIPAAHRFLAPGGHLLAEIAPGQGAVLLEMLPKDMWLAAVERDLARRERLVVARKIA